jgi:colanic acid biosynthesis glycosyl transferase WcaI
MRILFLTQWFDPEPGAIRGLPLAAWLVERGHTVTVVTGFPNYPSGVVYPGYRQSLWHRERVSGVDIIRVPLYPSRDRSAVRRVANFLSFAASASAIGTALSGPADVAYVYHPPPTVGLAALVQKHLRNVPFVYHIADMWPESVTESGMIGSARAQKLVGRVLSRWCERLYRASGGISVLSPGFRRLLLERGVPSDKVEVIYNWADESIFRPGTPDPALADTLGMSGRFNIVYSGNLGPFQRLDVAIEAAARLRHLPEIQLVLIGTGQCEEDLRDQAQRLGLDNVHFLGRQEYTDMGGINDLADVLLVSLDDLPFFAATIPSKTQVAMASGKPIVMAARGDAADMVEKAGAGTTCAPADPDALAAAFEAMYRSSPSDLAAMGASGREFYQRELSMERGGERTEAMLAAVVQSHRAARTGR